MAEVRSGNPNYETLFKILTDVGQALKTGEYSNLKSLATRQNTVLDRVLRNPDLSSRSSRNTVERLIALANRNQALLTAALSGLKSVRQRRQDVLNHGQTTQTYDRTGQRAGLEPVSAALEKRS